MDRFSHILQRGCEQLNLAPSEKQIEQLITYVTELHKWNKTYNLTAVRDPEEMIKRHLFDALSVLDHVQSYQPSHIADIGTGGGIPGIVLAIMLPETHVYLVESIGKKCRFLRHVTAQLGLSSRVNVVQQRVEAWQPQPHVPVIICRAFTSLQNFTTITQHLGNADSVWLAMKSAHTAEEIQALPAPFVLHENHVLHVPEEVAERHLLVLKQST